MQTQNKEEKKILADGDCPAGDVGGCDPEAGVGHREGGEVRGGGVGRQGLRAEAWAARAWFPGRKDGHFPHGLISADFLADIQLQFPALVTCDFLVTFQGDFLIMMRFRKPSRSCLIVLECECESCDMIRYCSGTIGKWLLPS